MGKIAQLPQRPSDILELEGGALERVLWDIAIMAAASESEAPPTTVAEKIRRKQKAMGVR